MHRPDSLPPALTQQISERHVHMRVENGEDRDLTGDRISTEILSRLQALEDRLRNLESQVPSVSRALLHRGFRVTSENSLEHVLLPADPDDLPDYLRLLKRYSFRLLLRDLIVHQRAFTLDQLVHYCSMPKARRYVAVLQRMRIVEQISSDSWALLSPTPIFSFGATLEWFVAQVLIHDFGVPASWNVSVSHLANGGDFDVLGVLDGRLLYVETKASPPRNLHIDVVQGFVQRLRTLRPDMAIFLVDTHLRLEDKINKMLRAALRTVQPFQATTVRLARGVFRLAPGVYAINSKPEIKKNLALCIRDFLAGPARSI